MGRLPGQTQPRLHRIADQEWRMVRWETSADPSQAEADLGLNIRPSLLPG